MTTECPEGCIIQDGDWVALEVEIRGKPEPVSGTVRKDQRGDLRIGGDSFGWLVLGSDGVSGSGRVVGHVPAGKRLTEVVRTVDTAEAASTAFTRAEDEQGEPLRSVRAAARTAVWLPCPLQGCNLLMRWSVIVTLSYSADGQALTTSTATPPPGHDCKAARHG